MVKAGVLGPVVLALAISIWLTSSAEARHRKHRHYDFRYSYQFQDVRQFGHVRHYRDEPPQSREDERRGREAFMGIVAKLIDICSWQAAELDKLPFDAIAQIAHPDDAQRGALDELRSSVGTTVDKLTSECRREISAPLSAQLDNVIQGIDTTVAALDAVRPPLQNFYGTLDDEQKARLLIRGRPVAEAPTQVHGRSSRSKPQRGSNSDSAPARDPLSALCQQLAASLHDWPIRQMESDMRLSVPQRVALYELAIASLKASNPLACPPEGALTPVVRLDTMRSLLSTMGAAISGLRPALLHFYEVLDERQKQRFVQM
jgi:hypothetical protein